MSPLRHADYEVLERAVMRGTRVAIDRPGRRQIVVVPLSLASRDGREAILARNPTTGDDLAILVDDVQRIEAVT